MCSHDWDDVRGKFEISKRDRWRHNDKLWYRNNRNAITISCDGACYAPNSDGRTIVRKVYVHKRNTVQRRNYSSFFFSLFVLVRCSFHTLYCCENSSLSSKWFRIEKYFCAKPCAGKRLYRVDVICDFTMTYCDGQRWRWWFYIKSESDRQSGFTSEVRITQISSIILVENRENIHNARKSGSRVVSRRKSITDELDRTS